MTHTRKPSASQTAAIRYFLGLGTDAVRVTEKTYVTCREAGWLERVEGFPFHRATPAGRVAIGLPERERHGTCGTCNGGIHEYTGGGWAHVIMPFRCDRLVPTAVR